MYSDPERSIPMDARPLIELSDRISTLREYPITIYGRLPGRQNIAAGVYRASVQLLIEY
jgi:spore coat protein U-like protein